MLRIILLSIILSLTSCSLIVNRVADSLSSPSSSGNTFTSDDDPELIADALPFALKMYETLLQNAPDNANLHLTTGSGFISYANAFVETPAMMLSDEEFETKQVQYLRAKKLYLRGRDYILKGLNIKHRGFIEYLNESDYANAFLKFSREDVPFLYWAAAGWMAAYSVDSFDFELSTTIKHAVSMMNEALRLDETYDRGAIHDFFISYYGALPESMGGSLKKAREHFARAVELSGGTKVSPYVSLATTVSIKTQNHQEFSKLLNKALLIDVNQNPDNRLANIISQRKARWYLDHKEDKFLLE
ncbi:MAG TPA: TRAP transporter TatT component family protein [Spirochaetota bacterium]|nr:TRAP transporter TatT component family protein [Spirochaetota bacterium]HPR49776.1 TRAP transporter TatT component family protein [Spirochaetota bacterium]